MRRIETAKIKCQKRKKQNGPMKRKTYPMKCTKDKIQNKCQYFFVKCDTNRNFCLNIPQYLFNFVSIPLFTHFRIFFLILFIHLFTDLLMYYFPFPCHSNCVMVPYFFSYMVIDMSSVGAVDCPHSTGRQ